MELSITTISSGWQQVLSLFLEEKPVRIATRHGISFDIPGLTVRLTAPGDLTIPGGYAYPELVSDYRERVFGVQQNTSLFYRRLTEWPDGAGSTANQMDGIRELLKTQPTTRSAVFSTWQPTEDLGAKYPVSPVGGCFRLVGGTLHLLLTARSVDIWVGFVPELLTFARLTTDLALDLGARDSVITYHMWSAHLYEIDYLTHLARLR